MQTPGYPPPQIHDRPPDQSNPYSPGMMPGSPMMYGGYPPPNAYSPSPNMSGRPQTGTLSQIGFVMGIVVGSIMLVGLIPCLGWMNWFTLFIGVISKFICVVAIFTEKDIPGARNKALIGWVITAVAIMIGGVRLLLGGGVC